MKIPIEKSVLENALRKIIPFTGDKGFQRKSLNIKGNGQETIISYRNQNQGVGVWAKADISLPDNIEVSLDPENFPRILSSFPDESIFLDFSDKNLKIISQLNKNKVTLSYVDDIADPVPNLGESKISISSSLFKEVLNSSAPYVSKDPINPVTMMVRLLFDNNKLKHFSTDGHIRLIYGCYSSDINENFDVYIPGQIAEKVIRILPDVDEKISISKTNNHIFIDLNKTIVKITPYVGEFDKKIELFSSLPSCVVYDIQSDVFSKALEIISLLMINRPDTQNKDLIQIKQKDGEVLVSPISDENNYFVIGNALKENKDIFFNQTFINDFLKLFKKEDAILIERVEESGLTRPPYRFSLKNDKKEFSMLLTEVADVV